MSEATAGASERVASLDAAGARTFDAAAFALVVGLVARAEALGEGRGGARLRARALREVASLEARLERAREDAGRALDAMDPSRRARAARALERGDVTSVRRAARRRERPRDPVRDAAEGAWLVRLAAEARASGVWSDDLADDGSPGRRLATIASLAARLYERSLDEAAAASAVARAVDAVPSASGPYNALALATRALGELGALSPAYLRAQLARLEDLGALLALPAEVATPRARTRRR